jgi:DNA-binding PadR family transcriptional regulator
MKNSWTPGGFIQRASKEIAHDFGRPLMNKYVRNRTDYEPRNPQGEFQTQLLRWQVICSTKSNDIMRRSALGELEELVLLIIGSLKDDAYGVTITQLLEKEASRTVDFSTVHTTLKRLEEKGLVCSSMTGATAERGGRRKRYFFITAYGYKALRESKEIRMRLWSLMPLKMDLESI